MNLKGRAAWLLTIVAIVALAAACGGSGPAPASTAVTGKTIASSKASRPAITPHTTTRPQPVVWSIAQARSHYLAYAARANAAEQGLAPWAGKPIYPADVAKIKRVAASVAAANDSFVRQLHAGAWPVSVRPQIATLETAVARERVVWLNVAHATSADDADSEWTGGNNIIDSHSAATEQVRVALGLPASG